MPSCCIQVRSNHAVLNNSFFTLINSLFKKKSYCNNDDEKTFQEIGTLNLL